MAINRMVSALGLSALAACGLGGGGGGGGGGIPSWASGAGGGGSDGAWAVASFADGSSVVAGSFSGTAVFGAGEPRETALVSAGESDVFVARYGPRGALEWARRAGGTAIDMGLGIASYADGSCVVTGKFGSTATFGSGEAGQTSLVTFGELDIFVARFRADGTLAWAKKAGGMEDDVGASIAPLPDGACAVTGRFRVKSTFGQGEPDEVVLTALATATFFIARYESDGTLKWAKRSQGSTFGIAAFADRSCSVTGSFSLPATFGEGEPNETELVPDSIDAFVARYDGDGALEWVRQVTASGAGAVHPRGISSFADGSCVVVGSYGGSSLDVVTFGPGETNETSFTPESFDDVFVARFEDDGDLRWAARAGAIAGAVGTAVSARADGSSIVTGFFAGTTTFGEGEADETTIVSSSVQNVFVARHRANGTLAWVERAGGAQFESASGLGVAAFSDGSSIIVGSFVGTLTFGAGAVTLTSSGGSDLFVARYPADGDF